jgi:hypothetical protein
MLELAPDRKSSVAQTDRLGTFSTQHAATNIVVRLAGMHDGLQARVLQNASSLMHTMALQPVVALQGGTPLGEPCKSSYGLWAN